MSDSLIRKPYDFGEAITRAFKLPGGISFLLRLALSSGLILLLLWAFFGRGIFVEFIDLMKIAIELEESNADESEVTAAMMGSMFSLMGAIFMIWIGSWLLMASTETAMHKNVFHGTDKGLFPLRFGVSELRVMLANFIVGLIASGVYMGGYFVFALLMLLAFFAGEAHVALGIIFGLVAVAGFIAWMGAMLLAYVRLAPGAAMSVRDDEIRTVEGWHITKKRFWPMLGSYLVIWIGGSTVMSIPMFLGFIVLAGPFMKLAGSENMESQDTSVVMEQIGALFSEPHIVVGLLIIGLVTCVLSMIYYMAIWGVANYVTEIDETYNNEDVFA